MATYRGVDDELIEEARRGGGHPTKEAAVTEALIEYIQRRQAKFLDLFGTFEFGQHDYRKQRRQS